MPHFITKPDQCLADYRTQSCNCFSLLVILELFFSLQQQIKQVAALIDGKCSQQLASNAAYSPGQTEEDNNQTQSETAGARYLNYRFGVCIGEQNFAQLTSSCSSHLKRSSLASCADQTQSSAVPAPDASTFPGLLPLSPALYLFWHWLKDVQLSRKRDPAVTEEETSQRKSISEKAFVFGLQRQIKVFDGQVYYIHAH